MTKLKAMLMCFFSNLHFDNTRNPENVMSIHSSSSLSAGAKTSDGTETYIYYGFFLYIQTYDEV